MQLPKVPGTEIRGATYHFKLAIPKAIQSQYPKHPAGVLRGTLKTADPKEAERRVREQRTIFDRQAKESERLAAREKTLGTLGQEDRDLLAMIGGPEKLLDTIRNTRAAAAFRIAGSGAESALALEMETGITPFAAESQARAEEAETRGAVEALTAQTRRLKRVAAKIGDKVPPAPRGIDEGVTGIRDLADKFMDARSYTVQNREDVNRTVRRWVEWHGDIAPERWERRHIQEFNEALSGLPITQTKALRDLTMRAAIARAQKHGLNLISPKTRQRYVDHMKLLSGFALDQLGIIKADPFARYVPPKSKGKFSAARKTKREGFAPADVMY